MTFFAEVEPVTVPTWLTVIAVISLGTAFLCAGVMLYDMYVRGYRQHM